MRWLPGSRSVFVIDVLVALWIVAWLILGIRVSNEVDGLRELSATISEAGGAVEQTGQALGTLDIPLVGGRIDDVAARIQETGHDTRLSGRTARESISSLSTLLGLSVALIPLSPIVFLYLPARVAHVREGQALRRLLDRGARDPQFDRLLAHRALQTLSYRELDALGGRPWADLAEGRYERLADAERARVNDRTRRRR